MEINEVLWKRSVDELVRVYAKTDHSYQCILCNKEFIIGKIYQFGEEYYDAYGAVEYHVKMEHGCLADYLLTQEVGLVGISEVQRQILILLSEGKDDREIAATVGIAQSTVRNHRFKLREKEKQAKLYLSLMKSLEEKTNRTINQSDFGMIEEVHQTAKMVDERYNITEADRKKTIEAYMDSNGAMKQFPAKEKKKIIILGEIMKNFIRDREYSESEVNKILKRINEDFPTIRRALIEYGFMDRSDDCRVYRVKE
jgi:transposase-like protein